VTIIEGRSSGSQTLHPWQKISAIAVDEGQMDGLAFETLPMPAPVFFDGQRLPASYAEFLTSPQNLNRAHFLTNSNDHIAVEQAVSLFPDRQVVGIACPRPRSPARHSSIA